MKILLLAKVVSNVGTLRPRLGTPHGHARGRGRDVCDSFARHCWRNRLVWFASQLRPQNMSRLIPGRRACLVRRWCSSRPDDRGGHQRRASLSRHNNRLCERHWVGFVTSLGGAVRVGRAGCGKNPSRVRRGHRRGIRGGWCASKWIANKCVTKRQTRERQRRASRAVENARVPGFLRPGALFV